MPDLAHQPFNLGETLRGTDDDSNLINAEILGQIHFFYSNVRGAADNRGNKTRRVGKKIKAIALRNLSGITLYGKRVALLKTAAGYNLITAVDGYCAILGNKNVVIIDEFLSVSGVAANDIFWGILEGPVIVLTPVLTGDDFNGAITAGAQIVGATAVTTQATSSGRVSNITVATAHATNAFTLATNMIGVALSTRTTGETNNVDLLINACIRM